MAVQPAVHSTSKRLWEALGRAFTDPDAQEGTRHQWHLLRYVDVVGDQLGDVDDLVRDSDAGPGWSALLDIDRVPLVHLAFLAQFVGVRNPAGTEAAQRAWVKARPGWSRGRVLTIVAAAQATLTGTKRVDVYERDGSAYRLRVRTYNAQTPDPAATEAAVLAAVPGGIVLTYESVAAGTYDQAAANFATYDVAAAAFVDYNDAADWVPP